MLYFGKIVTSWKAEALGDARVGKHPLTPSGCDGCLQEDQYDHLDAADVAKVEKSTNEAMEWMNKKLNLQNKQSLALDPVVKTKDIEAKIKVFNGFTF